jgi:hypothetical protein
MRNDSVDSAFCASDVVSGSNPASTIAAGNPAASSDANVGPERYVARFAIRSGRMSL